MTAVAVVFWDGDAWRAGLELGTSRRSRRWPDGRVRVVHLREGSGIALREIDARAYAARPLNRDGVPYPVADIIDRYTEMGQRLGISKRAAEALKEAL